MTSELATRRRAIAEAAAVRQHAAQLLGLMAPEPPRLIAKRRAIILLGNYQGAAGRHSGRDIRCPTCHQALPNPRQRKGRVT